MTRLLLTWIGVAALHLGTPHATSAAEVLRPGGESTSVVPRPDKPSKGALSRDRTWGEAVQIAPVTPFAPAASQRALRAFTRSTSPTDAPHRSAPSSPAHVLPDARAPPA